MQILLAGSLEKNEKPLDFASIILFYQQRYPQTIQIVPLSLSSWIGHVESMSGQTSASKTKIIAFLWLGPDTTITDSIFSYWNFQAGHVISQL